MKICRKCKKKVANKAKICKYCGADVTKCRIIKQPNTSLNSKKDEVKDDKKDEVLSNKNEVKKANEINKSKDKIIDNKGKSLDVGKKEVERKDEKKFNLLLKFKEFKKNKVKKEKALARKVKTVKEVKRLRNKKLLKYGLILFGIGLFIFLIVFGIRKLFHISDINVVKVGTYNNVFDMNERIKYKDVIYSVTDVYTSSGTEYKSPKDGNQYVVVTIDFENDSNDKVRYSYSDWKMSNSLGDESSRIFTPINVSTALYSGNLVVGGKKSGSLVFEEPIGDEELLLNYYEYKEEETKEVVSEDEDLDEIEEVKPVFQVRIKVPSDELSSN